MTHQPSIASYFGKRKRVGNEDIKRSTKALLLDKPAVDSYPVTHEEGESVCKVLYFDNNLGTSGKGTHFMNKINTTEFKGETKVKKKEGSDKKCIINQDIRPSLKLETGKIKSSDKPVKFQLLGTLSPKKKNGEESSRRNIEQNQNNNKTKISIQPSTHEHEKNIRNTSQQGNQTKSNESTEDIIKAANELVQKIKATKKKLGEKSETESVISTSRKELSLADIKCRLKNNSRFHELKESIDRVNKHAEKLIALEKRKSEKCVPKITKFDSIEVEVPSPKKSALYSPVKSPVKPAYQRYASLVEPTSTLPLSFSYQRLHELFCSADTICSMLVNRRETITFNKLKQSVQEMTRKNFTERHLGQIATVLPKGFKFHQEKVKNYGSTSKVDRYELVITPLVNSQESKPIRTDQTPTKCDPDNALRCAERNLMPPKVLRERREMFHHVLLEKIKDYHEEFLKTLEPPLVIKREELKRWHPNFMVDHVPDIIPQELPQPPISEKPCSAQDVLERAKNFLNNARLQKALEFTSSSQNASKTEPNVASSTDNTEERIKEKQSNTKTSNLLKGIPKALLEKIQARQAAKALEAMRRTPQEEKESIMYTRLPEIARIVRTAYINEQKGVLLLESLIERIQFSFKSNLSISEVEAHVKLLLKHFPEWLSLEKVRNSDYLKLNKKLDVGKVMEKLEKLIHEKK